MRRVPAQAYQDQFEYLADCFAWVKKQGDAYTLRGEALETERMIAYTGPDRDPDPTGELLKLYRGIEAEATRLREQFQSRKRASERQGIRFPIDRVVRRHTLGPEETQILLVLLYNEAMGRTHVRFANGHEILNLLFPDPVSALKAARFLDGGATLLAKGLVRSISDDDTANFLRAAYEVTEKTLRDVLGVRDRDVLEHQHTQAARKPLDSSYRVVAPQVSLDQVVLSERTREGIQEILWQVREGRDLYRRWGMDQVLEKGKGTIVLFSGPPGTGKTMTAEAMAHELGKPLYVADYSELESKWIGETEKNIVRIFREAAEAGAVLLLDEADAILSARLDGGHYNDRAYNRQVSLLLTEIEAFEGLCLLTTNRAPGLDEGLARRISGSFTFDVPGPGERLRIWTNLLPSGVPVAADVDLEFLARRFPMAGGHIKNAIITAIRKAAMRDGARTEVTQRDFTEAASVERRSFRAVSRPIGFGDTPLYAYG